MKHQSHSPWYRGSPENKYRITLVNSSWWRRSAKDFRPALHGLFVKKGEKPALETWYLQLRLHDISRKTRKEFRRKIGDSADWTGCWCDPALRLVDHQLEKRWLSVQWSGGWEQPMWVSHTRIIHRRFIVIIPELLPGHPMKRKLFLASESLTA